MTPARRREYRDRNTPALFPMKQPIRELMKVMTPMHKTETARGIALNPNTEPIRKASMLVAMERDRRHRELVQLQPTPVSAFLAVKKS